MPILMSGTSWTAIDKKPERCSGHGGGDTETEDYVRAGLLTDLPTRGEGSSGQAAGDEVVTSKDLDRSRRGKNSHSFRI